MKRLLLIVVLLIGCQMLVFAETNVALYGNDGTYDLSHWPQVKQLSMGQNYLLGLGEEGKVYLAGSNDLNKNQVEVWLDIAYLHADGEDTYGVTTDGRVLYAGPRENYGAQLSQWTSITMLDAFKGQVIGVKDNGQLVCHNLDPSLLSAVKSWTNMKSIAINTHVAGLKKDGTVVAVGRDNYGQTMVDFYSGVKKIDVAFTHTLVLLEDGTVKVSGFYMDSAFETLTDVVDAVSLADRVVAVTKNGKVVPNPNEVQTMIPDLSTWSDVKAVVAHNGFYAGLLESNQVYQEEVVTFESGVLAQLIANQLGIEMSQTYTSAMLNKVRIIDFSGHKDVGLKDLAELKYLKNLKQLTYEGQMTSFEDIPGQLDLTYLDVSRSTIVSDAGIERFPNLALLEIDYTALDSMNHIAKLSQLKNFYVRGTSLDYKGHDQFVESLQVIFPKDGYEAYKVSGDYEEKMPLAIKLLDYKIGSPTKWGSIVEPRPSGGYLVTHTVSSDKGLNQSICVYDEGYNKIKSKAVYSYFVSDNGKTKYDIEKLIKVDDVYMAIVGRYQLSNIYTDQRYLLYIDENLGLVKKVSLDPIASDVMFFGYDQLFDGEHLIVDSVDDYKININDGSVTKIENYEFPIARKPDYAIYSSYHTDKVIVRNALDQMIYAFPGKIGDRIYESARVAYKDNIVYVAVNYQIKGSTTEDHVYFFKFIDGVNTDVYVFDASGYGATHGRNRIPTMSVVDGDLHFMVMKYGHEDFYRLSDCMPIIEEHAIE